MIPARRDFDERGVRHGRTAAEGSNAYDALLLECEAALAERRPANLPDAAVARLSPADRERLTRSRECLEQLYALRPSCFTGSEVESQGEQSTDGHQGDWFTDPIDETLQVEARTKAPGARFGRYRVIREIGAGGHGIVFLALDETLQRDVALKVLRPECLLSQNMRRRFLREAQVAARLSHPHLLAIYDSGEEGIVGYLASAYCSGPTLAVWLRSRTEAISEHLAASIVQVLAEGVAYAHERSVVHRDIKPGNVFLDVSPQGFVPSLDQSNLLYVPKLGDFGLARFTDDLEGVTRGGTPIGTAAYMAPEQARGEQELIGPGTDVYGLGAVLFELLTCRPPFRGRSEVDTLRQVVHDEAPSLRSLRPGCSRDLAAICCRCLEKAPADRYGSATELALDLQRFCRGEPTRTRPVPATERLVKWARRTPSLAASLVATFAALLALVTVLLIYSSRLKVEVANAERAALEARQNSYTSDMRVAADAWFNGLSSETSRILARHRPKSGEPDLRDFVWNYLYRQQQEGSVVLARHAGGVTAVAASPDGKILATGGRDAVIRLWDAATRKQLAELRGHADEINALAFSPDGHVLASVGDDTRVRRWSVPSGASLEPLRGSSSWLADVEYSPDGEMIAAAGDDHRVRLWRGADAQLVCTFDNHSDVVKSIVFGPEGKLYSTSEDGEVRGFDVATFAPDEQLAGGVFREAANDEIHALALSADGRFLVGTRWKNGYDVWHVDGDRYGQACASVRPGIDFRAMATDSTGSLVFGGTRGVISIAHPGNGQFSGVYSQRYGHSDRVDSIACLPGTNQFLTGSRDGTARLFSSPLLLESEQVGRAGRNSHVDWRGDLISVVFRDGVRRAVLADMSRHTIVQQHDDPSPWSRLIAPRAKLTITSNRDGIITAERIDAQEATAIWSLTISDGHGGLASDDSGTWLATGDGTELLIINLLDGSIARRISLAASPEVVQWVPGTRLVAAGLQDGQVRVWDPITGELRDELDTQQGSVHGLSFTRDGARFATLSDNEICVWRREDKQLLGRLSHDVTRDFALVGKGETLVTLESEGLRFWRVSDGAEIMDMRGAHPCTVFALSEDGYQILTQYDQFVDVIDGKPLDAESNR